MSKLCTPHQAAERIQDGDTITISGTIGLMLPTPILDALESRFLQTGHPRHLTWFDVFPTGLPGIEPLAHDGLIGRVISGWYTLHPKLRDLIAADRVAAYCYPLGTLAFWMQRIAAGHDGLLTPVGVDTYVDPTQRGGRLNGAAGDELVTRTAIDGKDYLWYRPLPVNVAILRGTTVDSDGNLSLEREHVTMSVLYQALAAKRHGGTVIAQAARLVERGAIHPRDVVVPGELVDCIVIEPDVHWDEALPEMDWLAPWDRLPRPPRRVLRSRDRTHWRDWHHRGLAHTDADERPLTPDVIASRRAVQEMRPATVVNLGLGMPARDVISAAIDEDIDQELSLSIETGVLGGAVNGLGYRSGVTAILDTPAIFSLYGTQVMDATFLSMIEFDRHGHVNLLTYGDRWVGPGGSMDIAHHITRVVFLGTFTAGGLQAHAEDGRLCIDQEGSHPRAVADVQAICFNGHHMRAAGKDVLYVTERAVFRLGDAGPTLIEIAPGIDLDRDVLAHMNFTPAVSPDLRPMDPRIYRPGPLGLRDDWGLPPLPA